MGRRDGKFRTRAVISRSPHGKSRGCRTVPGHHGTDRAVPGRSSRGNPWPAWAALRRMPWAGRSWPDSLLVGLTRAVIRWQLTPKEATEILQELTSWLKRLKITRYVGRANLKEDGINSRSISSSYASPRGNSKSMAKRRLVAVMVSPLRGSWPTFA